MTFREDLKTYVENINKMLEQALDIKTGYADYLVDAMRYSVMGGGKRIRPMLVLEFCRLSGGDVSEALPVACAIEMLHTYSLIHDDLPCMDNDALRRGKPTNHIVYGECTATLAGDALQAEAFGTILRSRLSNERRAACAEDLANAVGLDGMCGGQYLDMIGEGKVLTEDQLDDINTRKTGALLIAEAGGADVIYSEEFQLVRANALKSENAGRRKCELHVFSPNFLY